VRTQSLPRPDSSPSLQAHLEPRPSIYPAIDPKSLYAAQSFSGKVVLVTGASRGVGRETALQYARAGASVAILARTVGALDETRDIIIAAVPGADVLVLTADVRDIESVRAAVESVIRHFGKLNILIANAGAITLFTPREDRSQTISSPFASFVCLWNLLFIYFI
jgi:NAD(P)-dependent dehydrogenase (short-subunit alcohol dehydrogenase family)